MASILSAASLNRPPAELYEALRAGQWEQAAAIDCSWQQRVLALQAERAAARREPETASRIFTLMAIALRQQGKLHDAVVMLEQEAEIAKSLAKDVQDCPPAEYDLIDTCLVRPEQEKLYTCRETCRNELFDLYGIYVGSTLDLIKHIDSMRSSRKRRKREAKVESTEDDFGSLKSQVEAIEEVLRTEARCLLIHKLREDHIQISLHGQSPHPDGCWISFRGAEAFNGTTGPTPVRRAFTDLIKSLKRSNFSDEVQVAVRDRHTLPFADTLWSAHWKSIGRFIAASSGVTEHPGETGVSNSAADNDLPRAEQRFSIAFIIVLAFHVLILST